MSTITRHVFSVVAVAMISGGGSAADAQQAPYGFGTSPSDSELGKFFAPLPDGRGLPGGAGSVAQGKVLYQEQCVACHGVNLQGGLADRLVGGRGTLADNTPPKAPVKTVESYWPYATTLFDYIKRAMPFTAPGSLTNDQVYAVVAYILAEAKIIPADAVIDAKNLPNVVMPNRDGFISDPRPEVFPPVANTPHQHLGIATTPK